VAAAAVLGALVGLLLTIGKGQSPLGILMPVIAAFSVAALGALAVKRGLADSGLHAMVASLVVLLPGAALTAAVLELAAGQRVSGSSRLVSGVMQLALLALGILAGIDAVGIPASQVFMSSAEAMGDWAPWVGVLVFAVGVTVAHSAPAKSLGGLLIVLYAAWGGQVLGNALLGGYVSAFIGAVVMTIVAVGVGGRHPEGRRRSVGVPRRAWLVVEAPHDARSRVVKLGRRSATSVTADSRQCWEPRGVVRRGQGGLWLLVLC
jgi:uncharacterized membrane protein YjjB (DUF3815 family)